MNKDRLLRYFPVLSLLLFFGCANPGTPTGGPKDELPPKMVKSDPEPNAMNFKGDKIVVTFDELIKLESASQKMVVSPPLNKNPTVVARGKNLLISFEDTLQSNTTYTIDLANAVVDNNEGNVYPNFNFSFSTGKVVDSMMVTGHLWEAGTLKPLNGMLVFIHENLSDTAIQSLVPVRLAKTDANGAFSIFNVRPGKYHLYALDDMNRDYKYDPKSERMAWSDSLIVPATAFKTFRDSVGKDSVHVYEKMVYVPDSLQLFMFQQAVYDQYLLKDERTEKAKLTLIYNEPLDSFKIEPVNVVYADHWAQFEPSSLKDTMIVWINDSTIYNRDSLTFSIQYTKLDSLENKVLAHDTITFYYQNFEVKQSKKKKKKEVVKIPTVEISGLANRLNVYSKLSFQLKTAPIITNLGGVRLYERVDTVLKLVDGQVLQENQSSRRYTIDRQWTLGGKYELVIDSASFVDVYGHANAEITHKFNVLNTDSYAVLYLIINQPEANWVVQIMDEKENVVRQAKVPLSGRMAFRYLTPSEYMFRVFVDDNKNLKWDTGDFKSKIQPEKVYYFPEKMKLRAEWEHELEWDKSQFSIYQFANKFRATSTTRRRE